MKQRYGKLGWLIASICFFAVACLGVALDEPQVNPPSSRQQSSKPEAPPTKVATLATQSAPKTLPPPSTPAVQPTPPVPQPAPPAPTPSPAPAASNVFSKEELNKGFLTPQMPPDRLWQELERDKLNYPIELWCKADGLCTARRIPNVNGTQWQARANMSVQGFSEWNAKYTALGYRLAYHQYYPDVNGVEFHQAVWLRNR
jgi:polyglycine hydrolase-like protein